MSKKTNKYKVKVRFKKSSENLKEYLPNTEIPGWDDKTNQSLLSGGFIEEINAPEKKEVKKGTKEAKKLDGAKK